jgi:hypothetical protein
MKLLIAIAAAAAILVSGAAGAATRTYPGAAPCDTTLQACADGAAAGDTIEIATDTPINEFVTANQSLTFHPAAGFHPYVQFIFAAAVTSDLSLTVERLSLGGVRALVAPGGGNLSLTVRNNVVNALGGFNNGIEMSSGGSGTGTYGTATGDIENNIVNQTGGDFECAEGIAVYGIPNSLTATIAGNTVNVNNLYECGGIDVEVGGSAPQATVVVDRNRVTGADFDFGIDVRNFGTNQGQTGGTLTVQVSNNLIAGQNGNTGAPAGIVASCDGYNGTLVPTIVNNTVADNRIGILVGVRDDLGCNVGGGLFNNIVAFNTQYGIEIETGATMINDDDDVFGNGGNFFTPGLATLQADPLFVSRSSGNYQLSAHSPAIDRGIDSALPPGFDLDLAGAPRRNGIIDLGAFEFGAHDVPTLRTDLIVALGGLLALLGLASLGARRTWSG